METASGIQAPAGGPGAPGHEHIREQVDQDGKKYYSDAKTGKTAWNKDGLLKAQGATGQQSPVAEPGEQNASVGGNKGGQLRRPSYDATSDTTGDATSDAAGGLDEVFGYDRVVPIGGYVPTSPPTAHSVCCTKPNRRIITHCIMCVGS